MPGNSAFIRSEPTLAWLSQFDPEDQPTASAMLRAMTLVSRDAFTDRLRALALQRLSGGEEPLGLYAERELPHWKGVPNRLFKETRTKVKRAFGVGPQPVQPTKAYNPDVGSEGLVAQLVSELCREYPKRFYNHPGPDAIRKHKIRRFVLMTDFIGSGRRARTYLQAAWRVRSVRSWWSAKCKVGLCFEVLAYAAAPDGQSTVEDHPSRPAVYVVAACPTIENAFGSDLRARVRDLCIRYDPGNHVPKAALGYDGTGALIACAHGVPNNTPRILHKRGARWAPLFPARVTSAARQHFSEDEKSAAAVQARLVQLRQTRLARAGWLETAKPYARINLLVLAALSRPPRQDEAVSRKTGLTVLEIQRGIARAAAQGWVDDARRLTERGQAELAHARKEISITAPLQPEPKEFYYPQSLRAPAWSSS